MVRKTLVLGALLAGFVGALTAVLPSEAAPAAVGETVTLTITEVGTGLADAAVDAGAGQQVVMQVTADGVETMSGVDFEILFDPAVLQVVDDPATPFVVEGIVAGVGLPASAGVQGGVDNTSGSLSIVLVNLLNLRPIPLGVASVTIAEIIFDVAGNPGDSTALTFANIVAGDGSVPVETLSSAGVNGSVTITPAAANDSYSTDEDTVLNVNAASGVLANDVDDAALSADLVSNVTSGTLALNATDGSFTYTPNANFNGAVSFTYKANDGTLVSNLATVNITVNAVNDAPTIANPIDDVTVNEDAVDTVVPLANVFTDVEDGTSLTLSVESNSNPTLVATSLAGTALTLDYQPEQNGSATIVVRGTDSGGASVDETFVVTVNAVNDAPTVANPIDDVAVNEDAANTVVDISGTFADVEDGAGLTLSVQSNSNSTLVAASLAGASLTLDYLPDQNGRATLVVRGTDSGGASVDDSFDVTVDSVNDAPTVANPIADLTVDEDAVDTVIPLANVFGDVDIATNGDSLALSVFSNTNPGLVGASIAANVLTLDYVENQSGTADITIRATDGAGAGVSVDDTFTVTVSAVNDVPTVANAIDDVAVDEDAANTVVDLSGTFTDVEDGAGLTLSVESNSNSTLVAATLAGNSLTLDYQPDQNGSATIVVRGTDSGGAFVDDSFDVTVAAVNDAPVANDDPGVVVTENTPKIIDVLANDTDVDIATNSDVLTVLTTTEPSIGSVTINADNTVTYTPDADQLGDDSFDYTIKDIAGLQSTATVSLSVVANQPPTAGDDTGATDEDTVLTDGTNVLDNDSDPESEAISVVDFDAASVAGAAVVVAASGSYTYDPTASETLQALAAGATTGDTFTYTVGDTSGGLTVATVTITVTGINDPPVAVDDAATVGEGGSTAVLVLANDSDPEGDTLSITGVSVPTNGTATINDNGTAGNTADDFIDYSHDGSETTGDSFTYTISDGTLTDTATVNTTITPVNDAPTVANPIDDVAVNEDADDTELDLSAIFADVDSGSLALSVAGNTNPSLVAASITAGQLMLDYVADQNGTAQITVRATDGDGAFVEDTFDVNVTAVNDAPTVASPISDVNVDEDAADTAIPLSGVFADVDIATNGDSLALTVAGNTNPGVVSATIAAGQLTLDYVADQNGTADITIRATDGDGAFVDDVFTATVNAINDAPVATADAYDVVENQSISVSVTDGVLSNDTDVEDDAMSAVLNADVSDGTLALSSDGSFTYTPDAGFFGTDTFTYVTRDADDSNIATVTITVLEDSDDDGVPDIVEDGAPNSGDGNSDGTPDSDQADVASLPDINDQYVTVAITSSLPTTTTATLSTVTTSAPPAGAPSGVDFPIGMVGFKLLGVTTTTVEIIPASAVVFGTYYKFGPEPGDATDHWYEFPFDGTTGAEILADRVVLHFVDGLRGDHDLTVNGEILDPGAMANNAPVAANDSFSMNEGDTLSVSAPGVLANDTDADGNALTAVLVSGPSGTLSLSPDGSFTYTPDAGFTGTDSFTYKANDGSADSNVATVSITVVSVGVAPPPPAPPPTPTPTPTPFPPFTIVSESDITPVDPEGGIVIIVQPTSQATALLSGVKLDVPVPAQATTFQLRLKVDTASLDLQPDGQVLRALEIDLFDPQGNPLDGVSFFFPASLTIMLSASEIDDIGGLEVFLTEVAAGRIKIQRLGASGVWGDLLTTSDFVSKTFTTSVLHFSQFALVRTVAASPVVAAAPTPEPAATPVPPPPTATPVLPAPTATTAPLAQTATATPVPPAATTTPVPPAPTATATPVPPPPTATTAPPAPTATVAPLPTLEPPPTPIPAALPVEDEGGLSALIIVLIVLGAIVVAAGGFLAMRRRTA